VLGLSLARGFLPPQRRAIPHHHDISEEIYYVVSGSGRIRVESIEGEINPGTLIYIPKSAVHALENTSDVDLEVLCVASPPYRDDDFILEKV